MRKRFLMITAGILIGVFLTPLLVLGATQLQNKGFEGAFVQYGDYNGWKLQVGEGWERYVNLDETYSDGDRLRYFSASDWAAFNGSPVTERVEGDNAQVWWSSSTKKFDAGIYQQVSGLTIGENYGFQAAVLQAFETTSRNDLATGEMIRQWGIDPYGGTAMTGTNVIWSPQEPHAAYSDGGNKYTWFWGSVGAQAMSTTMTVFVRVTSSGDGDSPHSDQVWVDDTYFDVAPTTQLTLTKNSPTELSANWSGQPLSGYTAYASEAQYRHISDTTWTDLQVFDVLDSSPPTATSANITIVDGETYLVRARTWHRIESGTDGRQHELAGPWVEQQYPPAKVLGKVSGNVLYNRWEAAPGVTVKVAGAVTETVSAAGGAYLLETGSGNFGLTATVSSGWTAPMPVQVSVVATETVPLTLTLRPPDDILLPGYNGDFEGSLGSVGLGGWSSTVTPTQFITQNQRSGTASLCVPGSGVMTFTAQVADMYRPTLGFWYKVEGGDGNDSMVAEIFGPNSLTTTIPLSLSAVTNGWQYAYLPLNLNGVSGGGSGLFPGGTGSFYVPLEELYNGHLGIRFTFNQGGGTNTTFCLDEVSAGKSRGGAYRIFLPLVLKNYETETPPGTVIPPVEYQCPVTSTNTYNLIPPEDQPADHPDYLHGDFNLAQRGWLTVTEDLNLVDISGPTAPNAPLISGMFEPDRIPVFTATYQVYDWDWGCGTHGCQGNLLGPPLVDWPVTLLGMETTPGEELTFPTNRGSDIYQGQYYAMVLYAAEERLTITYLRRDRSGAADGYAVHLEDVCVDPNLLSLYRAQVDEDGWRKSGYQLPGLKQGQIIGVAKGEQIKLAIRDKGKFMDPRSQKDWW